MDKRIYINALEAISPLPLFADQDLSEKQSIVTENTKSCIEPLYKQYIPPIKLRRMSRVVKMSLACSISCTKQLEIEKPDSIIIATSWGNMKDTQLFLNKIIDSNEQEQSPAIFTQSTHNMIGGHLALYYKCKSYNNVIVSNKSSFYNVLNDAEMLLIENPKHKILVGTSEELVYDNKNNHIIDKSINNPFYGEGAAFFILQSEKDIATKASYNQKTVFLDKKEDVFEYVKKEYGDILMFVDSKTTDLEKEKENIIAYRDYCGDYDTADAFGLFFAVKYLYDKGREEAVLLHRLTEESYSILLLKKEQK